MADTKLKFKIPVDFDNKTVDNLTLPENTIKISDTTTSTEELDKAKYITIKMDATTEKEWKLGSFEEITPIDCEKIYLAYGSTNTKTLANEYTIDDTKSILFQNIYYRPKWNEDDIDYTKVTAQARVYYNGTTYREIVRIFNYLNTAITITDYAGQGAGASFDKPTITQNAEAVVQSDITAKPASQNLTITYTYNDGSGTQTGTVTAKQVGYDRDFFINELPATVEKLTTGQYICKAALPGTLDYAELKFTPSTKELIGRLVDSSKSDKERINMSKFTFTLSDKNSTSELGKNIAKKFLEADKTRPIEIYNFRFLDNTVDFSDHVCQLTCNGNNNVFSGMVYDGKVPYTIDIKVSLTSPYLTYSANFLKLEAVNFGGYTFTDAEKTTTSEAAYARLKEVVDKYKIYKSDADIYLQFDLYNFKLDATSNTRNNVMTCRCTEYNETQTTTAPITIIGEDIKNKYTIKLIGDNKIVYVYEEKSSGGMSVPEVTLAAAQVILPTVSVPYLYIVPTAEQKVIFEDLNNALIKVDLSAVLADPTRQALLGLDSPIAWLKRNAIKYLDTTGANQLYEFTCNSNDVSFPNNELSKIGSLGFYYVKAGTGTLAPFVGNVLPSKGKLTLSSICYANNLLNGQTGSLEQVHSSETFTIANFQAKAESAYSGNITTGAFSDTGVMLGGKSRVETGADRALASGICNIAKGWASTALGNANYAKGATSLATGAQTTAEGAQSFTAGIGTYAKGENETVIGKYNLADSTTNQYAFVIGNGTSNTARTNALTVDWSGNLQLAEPHYERLTSTSQLVVGQTYHIIVPAGVAVADTGARIIFSSYSNISTTDSPASRTVGEWGKCFGYSAGSAAFFGFVTTTTSCYKLNNTTHSKFEADFVYSRCEEEEEGEIDENLLPYVYKFVQGGKLTLGADPTSSMEAATKQYVDSKITSAINGTY